MLSCQSVNPAKLYMPGPWATDRRLLVGVFLLSCLIVGLGKAPLATVPLDPVAGTPSQDEALYAHGALRMAAGEDWLTPKFLGRPLLVKPPLLQWLSAASVKTFGVAAWSLRLPSVLAAAGVLCVVFYITGPVGWLLLASCNLWRERAGLVLMDDLLTLFYLLALLVWIRDPKLEGRWAAVQVGLCVGLAVMTKWFAGLLPLGLFLYARPCWRKWLVTGATVAAVALPWHVYQWWANHDWFLAEYLGVELLGYAFDAPVQASSEGWAGFYLPRLLWLLPVALPLAARRWERAGLVWVAILLAGIMAYSYRNTTYLAPLAPALLLACRGPIAPVWAMGALGVFAGWPVPQPQLPITPEFAGREILHLGPDDQLRSSLYPGAKVRYVFLVEHLPPNGPLDFEKLGIAVPAGQFLQKPENRADVVLCKDLDALRQLILESPQRDFILPLKVWKALGIQSPHEVSLSIRAILRSRQSGPQSGFNRIFTGFRL